MEPRILLRATKRLRLCSQTILPTSEPLRRRPSSVSTIKRWKTSSYQANPIGDYYASLLESPSPSITSKPPSTATGASSSPISTSSSTPSSSTPDLDAGPAILFSSRLSSPLERRSEIQRKSTLRAGVWVPPRPEEPDDCCMSGCVNCVWDRYRDEVEEWAARKREADEKVRREGAFEEARRRRKGRGGDVEGRDLGLEIGDVGKTGESATFSIDDDEGGSMRDWDKGLEAQDDELFNGVPVGIREFMKQEKRLREKREKERETERAVG